MKRLSIGIDDFREVHRGYYFVDKSLFIKDITDHAGMVTLCTWPRRFGKNLNLDESVSYPDIYKRGRTGRASITG